MEGLLISEVAESAGTSSSAVRLYERLRLVDDKSTIASGPSSPTSGLGPSSKLALSMLKRDGILKFAIAAAVALTMGSVSAAAATTTVATSAPIAITIADGSITLSSSSVVAGVVRFTLTNTSVALHEIDVVRAPQGIDKLPVTPRGNFNEHTKLATVVREAVKIQPKATRSFQVRLTKGTYALLDNLPGHFAKRELAGLTVT